MRFVHLVGVAIIGLTFIAHTFDMSSDTQASYFVLSGMALLLMVITSKVVGDT